MIKSASRSSITNDQKYRSMLAGTAPSSEYLIDSRVLDTAVSFVTFDNLAQYAGVYKHLQIILTARTDRGTVNDIGSILINSDTGRNYAAHRLIGNDSTVTSTGFSGLSSMASIIELSGAAGTTNNFSSGIIDITDAYANKNKTARVFSGRTTDSPAVSLSSGLWNNTSGLTSIRIVSNNGSNFVAGSRFSLYGVTA